MFDSGVDVLFKIIRKSDLRGLVNQTQDHSDRILTSLSPLLSFEVTHCCAPKYVSSINLLPFLSVFISFYMSGSSLIIGN